MTKAKNKNDVNSKVEIKIMYKKGHVIFMSH